MNSHASVNSAVQRSGVRPLVMRCGAFGDMVLLTPLLRQLHARFGEPVDLISSGPWTLPLLKSQPGVGEIFILGSRKAPYWLSRSQQALVRWLRRRGAGPTWFCDPGVGAELLARAGLRAEHICDSREFPWIPGEHFVERWIRLANMTPCAFMDSVPGPVPPIPPAATLEIDNTSRDALNQWLARRGLSDRKLVLIQAGNKRTMRGWSRRRATNTKYWPEERWAEVIRAVRSHAPDHAVGLLGVPAEHALNEDILRHANTTEVYNLADHLPIETLLPLLERASSLISVDTGPAHAAAALGCPTVALFGRSDPALYRPGGVTTPAAVVTGEIDGKRSMLAIEPAAVIRAWRSLIAERAGQ